MPSPQIQVESTGSGRVNLGHILTSGLVGAVLSLAVMVAYFHYTDEKPILYYEVFPGAAFQGQSEQVNITNARIENAGDSEATEVTVHFVFGDDAVITNHSVNPSALGVDYQLTDSTVRSRGFRFPLINPAEGVRFSFLLEGPAAVEPSVDLRGRGITGSERSPSTDEDLPILLQIAIVLTVFGALLSVISVLWQVLKSKASRFGIELDDL